MTESQITIAHTSRGEVEILEVRGALDLTNTSVLEEGIARTKAGTIVLDLGLVVFVDSAGIRAIDHANRTLRESDRTLVIVAPPESRAAWTFRIAGFDSTTVLDSVDAVAQHIRASDGRPPADLDV
jgi:anti-anti-sigma factor